MREKAAAVIFVCVLLVTGWLPAQTGKPDFSGIWKFNREKSELKPMSFRPVSGGPSGGGDFGGEGGMGGGPGGMGGGGMAGPGMGGPGMPGGRGPGRSGPGRANSEMMGVAEVLKIALDEPNMTVDQTMKFGDREQILHYVYTTDGKKNENTLPGNRVTESKTRWKKDRLITTSSTTGPMGKMQVVEERTLSEDGKTMTVKLTMKSDFMDWTRKLVYEKENPAVENP